MATQQEMDSLYMGFALRAAKMSHARRAKVGCVIVRGNNTIVVGWNGMPAGMDNNCEHEIENGQLVTKPEVLHAEFNAAMKLVREGGFGTQGGTAYTTLSPCVPCAKLLSQAGLTRIVYLDEHENTEGLDFLNRVKIDVSKFVEEK